MHYGPFLEAMLKGSFAYARKTGLEPQVANTPVGGEPNGGDSSWVLAYLRAMAGSGDFRPDVLLVNCGLHDIKTDPKTLAKQVPLEDYRRNLRGISEVAASLPGRFVWVRTTPVDEAIHNSRCNEFHRFARDVASYNQAADEVMAAAGAAAIDLHGFTAGLGGEIFCDHVHFPEPIRRLQAAYIAGFLRGSRD
jgi:acetoin utilization deacetylase AcuC-like enzyme